MGRQTQTLKNKATKLHSQVVRSRGTCENCGSTNALQCAHIISRRYTATRCDPLNAFCLCAKCHFHFTEWPLEFHTFVITKVGEQWYENLKLQANLGIPATYTRDEWWQYWIDRLS